MDSRWKKISIKCKKKMCFWPWQNNHREQIAKNAGSAQNHCDKRVDASKLEQLKEDYSFFIFYAGKLEQDFSLFLQMGLSLICQPACIEHISHLPQRGKELPRNSPSRHIQPSQTQNEKLLYLNDQERKEWYHISRKKVLDTAGLAKVFDIWLI